MLFNRSAKTVFIDTETVIVPSEEMLNIILSPAYYWVKRVTLPVKYLRDVKKVLPTMFEDIVPEGKYSYEAYRDGENYIAFAYSDKAILDDLAAKGVKPTQINAVYFAQSEFADRDEPVRIGEESVMLVKNGIVIKLPAELSSEPMPLLLKDHRLSRQKIELARYAHIADRKSLQMFAAFMGVLITVYAAEWIIIGNKTGQIEAEQAGVYAEYGLKSTRLQNEAMLNKLERKFERQMHLRRVTASLLGAKLLKDEQLERFSFKEEKVVIRFAVATQKRADAIAAALIKTEPSLKKSYREGILQLEVTL